MQKKNLNVIVVIVLMLGILIGLTACGTKEETKNETSDSISNDVMYTEDDVVEIDEVDDETMEMLIFNSSFQMYEGDDWEGSDIADLLSMVIENNMQNDRIIEVEINNTTTSDTEELASLKSKIVSTKKYSVTIDYEDDGYVKKLIIK